MCTFVERQPNFHIGGWLLHQPLLGWTMACRLLRCTPLALRSVRRLAMLSKAKKLRFWLFTNFYKSCQLWLFRPQLHGHIPQVPLPQNNSCSIKKLPSLWPPKTEGPRPAQSTTRNQRRNRLQVNRVKHWCERNRK